MAQPGADHVDLDAGLEQADGGGVTQDMRRDPYRLAVVTTLVEPLGMMAHDLVDPEAGQCLSALGAKDRPIGSCVGGVLLEELHKQT